jgi:hypothetical protein
MRRLSKERRWTLAGYGREALTREEVKARQPLFSAAKAVRRLLRAI